MHAYAQALPRLHREVHGAEMAVLTSWLVCGNSKEVERNIWRQQRELTCRGKGRLKMPESLRVASGASFLMRRMTARDKNDGRMRADASPYANQKRIKRHPTFQDRLALRAKDGMRRIADLLRSAAGLIQAVCITIWTSTLLFTASLLSWLTHLSRSLYENIILLAYEVLTDVVPHWIETGIDSISPVFVREQGLLRQLHAAENYEEWRSVALELDRLHGHHRWKMGFECELYNYNLIRDNLDALYKARKKDDRRQMAFLLRSTLHRDVGGMGNPELFRKCYIGTKDLIEQYIEEVRMAFSLLSPHSTLLCFHPLHSSL